MSRQIIIALGVALFASALFGPSAVRGDVVVTKDDRRIEGRIVEESDQRVVVKLKFGSITIERKDIRSIERKQLPIEELQQRRAALDARDADGRAALARFAIDNELPGEAIRLLLEAIKLKPAHRKTRLLLDELDYHESSDGRWLSPDEYYPTIGWIKRRGRWVSREDAALIDANADKRKVEKQLAGLEKERRGIQRKVEDAADAVGKAELRLRDAENKIAQADGLIAGIQAQLPGLERQVRDQERNVAEARALLTGFALGPAIPGETEQQRAARLQRYRELEILAVREERELRRLQAALDRALRDIAELESFRARGPQVIEERRLAITRAQEALDAVRAREGEIDDQVAGAREALLELDLIIRDLKDAKARADATRSLEEKRRAAGRRPKLPPSGGSPEPDPADPPDDDTPQR